MPETKRRSRLSVDFTDDERPIYRALKIAAFEQETTMRDIVITAVRDWLRKQENQDDLAAIAEAEAEGGEDIPWEQVKADLRTQEAPEQRAS